jgi:hypothetical protein
LARDALRKEPVFDFGDFKVLDEGVGDMTDADDTRRRAGEEATCGVSIVSMLGWVCSHRVKRQSDMVTQVLIEAGIETDR